MKKTAALVSLWTVFAFCVCRSHADVKLPALFGDHMLLQRDKPVRVWGSADPGEPINVAFAGQTRQAVAGADGKWSVQLDKLAANDKPDDLSIQGKNKIVIHDVLVGDVWVASGQSNMAFQLQSADNSKAEIAGADYPLIRLFNVKLAPTTAPASDVEAKWAVCTPQSVPTFSAVAYFFGRDVQAAIHVPIGLLDSSVSGTVCEAWTSQDALAADPLFKPILDRWVEADRIYPAALENYKKQMATWQASNNGKPDPHKMPSEPLGPIHRNHPAALYNGMIAPLVPYAIRGVIWYQGEFNSGRAYQYRQLFPAMIKDWRTRWDEGDFPFLYVQLANVDIAATQPAANNGWAELREAQLMSLSVPNTAMAVIIDTGDPKMAHLHPPDKQDVGHRLALAAQGMVYGLKVEYHSPIYDSMKVEGDKIRVKFKYADGGLVTKDGGPLKGFAIAGDDRKFVWAEATIEKTGADTGIGEVLVSSDQVKNPVAVRYGWAMNPPVNLFNKAGLPASPFRTDDWPGLTANKVRP